MDSDTFRQRPSSVDDFVKAAVWNAPGALACISGRGSRINIEGEFMKRILMIAMAALFISSGWANSSVPSSARNRSQEKQPVSSIRQRYAAINKGLAKYRVVKKELSGFSTEGGELIAYFDGPAIVKIAATYLGETGRSFEEFYYWNEKLIFVYRKQDTYDEPMSGKVVKTRENRFYFSKDELIRWINENAKQVAPGIGEYSEKQIHYLDSSKRFTEGARSQQPTIEAPELNP
jgi:hypothetical protein